MATNTILINFVLCQTAPSLGYQVYYRPAGSSEEYRQAGPFTSTPIQIVDTEDELGQQYEGYMVSDCGGGKLGPEIPFETSPGSSSVSVSESGSESLPDVPVMGFVSNSIPDITVNSLTFDGILPTYDSGTDFPISTMESGNFITGVNNMNTEVIVNVTGSGTPAAVELTDSDGVLHIGTWVGAGNYTFNNIPIYDGAGSPFDWFIQIV